MDHPSDEILKRFATGKASREERGAVVAHLLRGCSQCARKLRALMNPPALVADSYDAAFDRFDGELFDRLESELSPPARPASPPLPRPFGQPRGRPGSRGRAA